MRISDEDQGDTARIRCRQGVPRRRRPSRAVVAVVAAWMLAFYAALSLADTLVGAIISGAVALVASWVAVFLAWWWMGRGILGWLAAVAAGWLTFQVTVWSLIHFSHFF